MKNPILLLALIFTLTIKSFAQLPDKALIRVNYIFSHLKDTSKRELPYTENMLLFAGKNASLYTSEDRINQVERMTAFIKQQTAANGGTLSNVVMQKGLLKTVSLTDFYFFSNERKLITIENMREKFRIDEEATPIPWKITKDTSNFSGIHCQKAEAYFKGRNWIAWFAPDLPFASGPWKLNSLPGLIIEAYDDRKDIKFSFAGLSIVKDEILTKKNEVLIIGTANLTVERDTYTGKEVKIPSNTVKATREEVERLKNAIVQNPAAALNGLTGGPLSTVKRSSGPSTPQPPKKILFNNPIELPEKIH